MNRNKIVKCLIVGALLLGAVVSKGAAATPNIMLSGPTNATFPAVGGGQPSPTPKSILAKLTNAPDVFIGDYISVGAQGVGFRMRVDTNPSLCNLYFYSASNVSEWSYSITNKLSSNTSVWVTVFVPFVYGSGWSWWDSGATGTQFTNDLKTIDTIGVRVTRNGALLQKYQIMDFMLLGGSQFATGTNLYKFMVANALTSGNGDNDKDGLSNWGEFLVGSDPLKEQSGFKLQITRDEVDGKVYLVWPHMAGRKFAIWRSSISGGGFDRLTAVGAEKPSVDTGNRELVGEDETEKYFYKVEILE